MAERQQERAELVAALRIRASNRIVSGALTEIERTLEWQAARLLEEDGKEIERLDDAYRAEYAIVDRIWGMFGRPSYEQLAGRSIYDLIQSALDRAEKAEARVSELEQALEDLGEAHRLLAAQGLMAACADEGKDQ
jgi:hypothetical protein